MDWPLCGTSLLYVASRRVRQKVEFVAELRQDMEARFGFKAWVVSADAEAVWHGHGCPSRQALQLVSRAGSTAKPAVCRTD
jgi:hypothetical protein